MVADAGYGTTIQVGTVAEIEVLRVSWTGVERAAIGTTHLLTVGGKTFIPSDVFDPGALEFALAFDPANKLTRIDDAAANFSINWGGQGSSSTWTASMFFTGFDQTAEIEERMEQEISAKVSGNIT